jgi:hypothetical protein
MRFVFYVFVGHFDLDLNCSYTLDHITALIRSPIYALRGLAVPSIQYKVNLFVFEVV